MQYMRMHAAMEGLETSGPLACAVDPHALIFNLRLQKNFLDSNTPKSRPAGLKFPRIPILGKTLKFIKFGEINWICEVNREREREWRILILLHLEQKTVDTVLQDAQSSRDVQ